MNDILMGTLLVCVVGLVFCDCFMRKNLNTCKQQQKILFAISEYRCKCIRYGFEPNVDYDDMEDYDSTLFRFWDWGYTNILPKEKFEIIKPFIKEE